jgi:hypothetical protein
MTDPVAERRAGLRERLLQIADDLERSVSPGAYWVTLREAAHSLEASSEAPQAGPVVNGGGNHYDNPATWAKEASPAVDREASSSVTPSVPAFEVCPFCRNLGFVADNIVYKNCERHRDVDTGSAPQTAKESR